MKIYEVSTGKNRQWFDKKAEAQAESKRLKVPMIDHELGSTRSGFVEFLNKVADPSPTATRTVVRVTASKPPVPEGWTHADT